MRSEMEITNVCSARHIETLVFSPLHVKRFDGNRYCPHTSGGWNGCRYCRQSAIELHLSSKFDTANGRDLANLRYASASASYAEHSDPAILRSKFTVILLRGLQQLRNVKCVKITDGNDRIGAREIYEAYGCLDGEELSLGGKDTLPIFFQALMESGTQLETLEVGGRNDCMGKSSRRGPCLPVLFPDRDLSLPEVAATMDHLSTATESSKTFFSQLKSLDISYDHFSNGTGPVARNLCKYAGQIEKLTLRNLIREIPLEDVLGGDYIHSRIATLSIEGFVCVEANMIEHLSSRAKVLVNLTLTSVNIAEGGDWSNVLLQLRAHTFTKLRTFVLKKCSPKRPGTNFIEAADFVTRESSVSPYAEL